MNSKCHYQDPSSLLKAVTAFLMTVVVGMYFLNGFNQNAGRPETTTVSIIEQTVPGSVEALASLVFVPEPLCMSSEIQWFTIDDHYAETTPDIPDTLNQRHKVPFQGIIVQAAGRYQVDPHLIRAIIFAESGYNPKATSKKGARGLMQLMPSTAKALGVQDIYDPAQNVDGGVRYFRSLLDRFDGDVKLALAAYNAGSRHVRNYEGVPPFKATRRYIKKVLKFKERFKMETASIARGLAVGV